MKICMMNRVLPIHEKGGMQDHTLALALGLVEAGHSVDIITTAHPWGLSEENIGDLHIHYLAGTVPSKYSKEWWKKSAQELISLHSSEPFDVLHSQSAAASHIISARLNKKIDLPAVVSVHGVAYDALVTVRRTYFSREGFAPIRGLANMAYYFYIYLAKELKYLRSADAVIATSDEQERIVRQTHFINPSRVFKVYNGVDTDLFKPQIDPGLRSTLLDSHYDRIILCVARITKQKGVQVTLRALPIVLRHLPRVKLVVVGDGPYLSALKALATKCNLNSWMHFTGFIEYEKLSLFFGSCDVFVNSTIQENGYDLTILEALACGKPVIVSDLRTVRSVIKDGQNGLLVRPGDHVSLAKAIIDVLSDNSLANRLSMSARSTIVERFNIPTMVQGTIKVYEKVIRGLRE